MIENTIYDRLSNTSALTNIVGTSIYPTTPTENTQLPFLVYTVTSSSPELHLNGDSGLGNYTVQIDAYAINLDTVQQIMAATKAALHTHRAVPVQGVFLTEQATQQEEYGFHGLQTFTAWVSA